MNFHYNECRIISSETRKNILGIEQCGYSTVCPSEKNSQVTPMLVWFLQTAVDVSPCFRPCLFFGSPRFLIRSGNYRDYSLFRFRRTPLISRAE